MAAIEFVRLTADRAASPTKRGWNCIVLQAIIQSAYFEKGTSQRYPSCVPCWQARGLSDGFAVRCLIVPNIAFLHWFELKNGPIGLDSVRALAARSWDFLSLPNCAPEIFVHARRYGFVVLISNVFAYRLRVLATNTAMPLVAGEDVRTPFGAFRVVFGIGHFNKSCI